MSWRIILEGMLCSIPDLHFHHGSLAASLRLHIAYYISFMTPNNFREKANFIRQVAGDTLRVHGTFKAHKYGDVILPLVVLRRLDLVLEPKKDDVIKQYEQFKDSLDEERLTPILCQAAGEPTSTTTPSMTCAGWPRIRRISS